MSDPLSPILSFAPEIIATATIVVEVEENGAKAVAVKVSVEATLPLAGGVTVAGENEAVTPVGRLPIESVTGELNPF